MVLGCSKQELPVELESGLVATNLIVPTKKKEIKANVLTYNSSFSRRLGHSAVVFQNKLWVIYGSGNGYQNDIWFSDNGIQWNTFTSPSTNPILFPRVHHSTLVHDNKIWIIGGISSTGLRNDVLYSSNGENWQYATSSAGFSKRYKPGSLVFNNKLWIIGGLDENNLKNDVWSSSDGITWTQVNSNAGFSGRFGHACAVFNNRMWVFGGNIGSGLSNDVWNSIDGITWNRVYPSEKFKSFSARENHTVTVYKEMLWVYGGKGNDAFTKNDLWCSKDGKDWTLSSPNQSLPFKSLHTSTVFHDSLIIIGGADEFDQYKNDIWALGY